MLSIITITCNDALGLEKTLRSLQPLFTSSLKWEHIIIDSSSEINSDIRNRLPQRWPLQYETAPARGVYAGFNVGLDIARGDYIWFLNGGDCLKDISALETTLTFLDKHSEVDFAACNVELHKNDQYLYTQRARPSLLQNILGSNKICQQSVLYRRRVFNDVGLFSTEYEIAGDYEHHLRCFARGCNFKAIHELLTIYDTSGISSSNYEATFTEFRKAQKTLVPLLASHFNIACTIVFHLRYMQIRLMKCFASSALSGLLHPLWFSWKRRT